VSLLFRGIFCGLSTIPKKINPRAGKVKKGAAGDPAPRDGPRKGWARETWRPVIARLNGATDAEIEDAVQYAKSSAGWSASLNGLQVDYEKFRGEALQACEHVRKQTKAA